MEVANVGGIQTNVNGAEYLDIDIVSSGGILAGLGASAAESLAPKFEVPARQMRVLQNNYTKLNVSKSGTPIGAFDYPEKLY